MTEEEKIREAKRHYLKKWRTEHKEHVKEYSRQWRNDNPDKVKAAKQRYYLRYYTQKVQQGAHVQPEQPEQHGTI